MTMPIGSATRSIRLRSPRLHLANLPGQALFELALLVPLLLLVMLSIIEYSRALNMEQRLVDLTRQGSNMASRGTALSTAAAAVAQGSAPLNVSSAGEVIITSVQRVSNVDTITGQATSGAINMTSKIGTGVGTTATVPAAVDDIFTNNSGQTVYITEVFYPLTQITPVARMWNLVLPSTMYQVAYF
jgi:Flp pilus assembly protein TadG